MWDWWVSVRKCFVGLYGLILSNIIFLSNILQNLYILSKFQSSLEEIKGTRKMGKWRVCWRIRAACFEDLNVILMFKHHKTQKKHQQNLQKHQEKFRVCLLSWWGLSYSLTVLSEFSTVCSQFFHSFPTVLSEICELSHSSLTAW